MDSMKIIKGIVIKKLEIIRSLSQKKIDKMIIHSPVLYGSISSSLSARSSKQAQPISI
jgi:hypothetical protein